MKISDFMRRMPPVYVPDGPDRPAKVRPNSERCLGGTCRAARRALARAIYRKPLDAARAARLICARAGYAEPGWVATVLG